MKIPRIVEAYYPNLTWRIPTEKKELYLTFDDGPTPYVTKWALSELRKYNAKATFFCVGKNVKNHPAIYKSILEEGHSVGNHTFDHKNGWNTGNYDYMKSVIKCENIIKSDLFRPPYGRIKKAQIKGIKSRYRIIMWDVLTEDYKTDIPAYQCVQNVLDQAKEGSIVVLHDSKKSTRNPQTLRQEWICVQGNRLTGLGPEIFQRLIHQYGRPHQGLDKAKYACPET